LDPSGDVLRFSRFDLDEAWLASGGDFAGKLEAVGHDPIGHLGAGLVNNFSGGRDRVKGTSR
jgi:hypothetical protein